MRLCEYAGNPKGVVISCFAELHGTYVATWRDNVRQLALVKNFMSFPVKRLCVTKSSFFS